MTDEERKEIEESIADASKKGLYRRSEVRPGIKLPKNAAKIFVGIPMGDKDDPDLFVCPDCGYRHFGVVHCEKCGHDHSAERKLRHAGLAPIEWLMNALQVVPPLLCSVSITARKSVLSGQARNEMTYDAVRMGSKYIFYWDDDTMIPPKAIYDMHSMMERQEDAGIITGVYVTRESCPEPILYKNHGEGAYWTFIREPGVLEEVFAAGAGCMMARVSALEEMEKLLGGPWWTDEREFKEDPESGDPKSILWGHDVRFCRRMAELGRHPQASQAWKVYVAGWLQCGHLDLDDQKIYVLPEATPAPVVDGSLTYVLDKIDEEVLQASLDSAMADGGLSVHRFKEVLVDSFYGRAKEPQACLSDKEISFGSEPELQPSMPRPWLPEP